LPTFPAADIVAALRAAGCVFAEDEARLLVDAARSPADLAALVNRRVGGEPLEHVLGWAEFCGLRIAVDPAVFVPRRRTELLVRLAADLLVPGAVVIELCCGAAAVATALAVEVPGVALHAVDIDPAAVRCARRNLDPIGGRVYQGDLDAPLPAALRGHVDVLVANAPYVPTDLLIETSEGQAPHTAAAVARAGLSARVERCEELDATAVVGRFSR
jgi:release factor glutamine methyltransferase